MPVRQIVASVVALLFAVYSNGNFAQEPQSGVAIVSGDAASKIPAFSYREGPESRLQFRTTALVPMAAGEAEVEYQDGRSRINVNLHKLPDAWTLGPYATYVLWALTVEGRATNLGELEVHNGYAELQTAAPLAQFALVVSAEPHFGVTMLSNAVVLINFAKDVKGRQQDMTTMQSRADYASLTPQNIDPHGRVPLDLYQARYAMAIANAANAAEFAPQVFGRADALLKKAETAQASKKYSERRTVAQTARDAVQALEEARHEAVTAHMTAEEKTRQDTLTAQAAEEARQRMAAAQTESERAIAAAAATAATAASAQAHAQARADLLARLNRALPTTDTPNGLVAQIAGVQFAKGAATLSASARESLARFSGIVLSYPDMRFLVEGHTDNTGQEATNVALSLKRAITVRDYLIAQGVAASTIDVKGAGSASPVADNTLAAGRASNRRVEIIMSGGPIETH
jgi:outer membrane protein OmpA-like peptidoglycan-associated protein